MSIFSCPETEEDKDLLKDTLDSAFCESGTSDPLIPQSRLLLLPGPKVIKLFPCSNQLSMKLILLINVKMPTVVGILTFMSRINIINI